MNRDEILKGWKEVVGRNGGKQKFERELLPHLDEATKTAYGYVKNEI
jgi:hypothetical protein